MQPRELVPVEFNHLALTRERTAHGQRPLDFFGQVIRRRSTHLIDVRLVILQLCVLRVLRLQRALRHIRQLESEPRQIIPARLSVLLHQRPFSLLHRIIHQPRVRAQRHVAQHRRQRLLDALVRFDRREQRRVERPLVRRLESFARLLHRRHRLIDRGVARSRVSKVFFQVPSRFRRRLRVHGDGVRRHASR